MPTEDLSEPVQSSAKLAYGAQSSSIFNVVPIRMQNLYIACKVLAEEALVTIASGILISFAKAS